MNTVVIQHIETVWTKRSRGGDGARKRNVVPLALDFPSISRDCSFVLHHATFHEYDSFARQDQLRWTDAFADLELRFLTLSIDGAVLRVRVHRDGSNAATPSPFPYKDPFVLEPGLWGRLVYNGRFTAWNTGNWWYEKHVYNIGWFDEWTSDAFVKTKPHSEYREMARLR